MESKDGCKKGIEDFCWKIGKNSTQYKLVYNDRFTLRRRRSKVRILSGAPAFQHLMAPVFRVYASGAKPPCGVYGVRKAAGIAQPL